MGSRGPARDEGDDEASRHGSRRREREGREDRDGHDERRRAERGEREGGRTRRRARSQSRSRSRIRSRSQSPRREHRDRHDRDRGRDRDRDRHDRRDRPRHAHADDRATDDRRRPDSRGRGHSHGHDNGHDRVRDRDRDRDRDRAITTARHSGPLPDQAALFAHAEGGEAPPPPKEKPNWGTTGALAAASNTVAQADGTAVTLKYHEPPEARKPSPRDEWKLFVFKDGAIVDTVDLGARSCWLAGRDAAVADLLAAHPSISKQHAVLQFRYVEKRNEFGDRIGRVKPYLLDLASANGTLLNGAPIATQRYVELRDKDLVQFGHSSREYVVMLAPRD